MNRKEIFLTIALASVLFNVVFIICLHKMCVQQDVARTYINELEEQVGDNLMDTVGSGDAYANYYKYQ